MDIITGTSSGLGHGLAEYLLQKGEIVAGISRRPCDLSTTHSNYFHYSADLSEIEELPARLRQFYQLFRDWIGSREYGPVRIWLNAGVLGRIDDLQNTTLSELRRTTDINLWANKALIDSLVSPDCPFPPAEVVAVSSGASVNGNRGWSGYSISKAALNMMIKLYSEELPDVHFTALAPGLIESAMQDSIAEIQDTARFSALKRLQDARGTPDMPAPLEAAQRIMEKWPVIAKSPSGSFLDIRKI